MTFLELAKERYSVRKFSEQRVEDEKLDLILEAGRIAPTAKNLQSQRILVIRSEEGIKTLNEQTPCVYGATTALLICADKKVSWINEQDGHSSVYEDASIVATHMMLEAWELGVGSCWVGVFHHEELKKAFNIPEDYEPCCILMLGYPKEGCKPSGLHFKKVDKSETVFYDKF